MLTSETFLQGCNDIVAALDRLTAALTDLRPRETAVENPFGVPLTGGDGLEQQADLENSLYTEAFQVLSQTCIPGGAVRKITVSKTDFQVSCDTAGNYTVETPERATGPFYTKEEAANAISIWLARHIAQRTAVTVADAALRAINRSQDKLAIGRFRFLITKDKEDRIYLSENSANLYHMGAFTTPDAAVAAIVKYVEEHS